MILVPDVTADLCPAHDSPRIAGEKFEQRVLFRRERKEHASPVGCLGTRVDDEVRDHDLAIPDLSGAAKQRTQPSEQLGELEWLDQIVIGIGVQPLHLVGECVPRCEHQDRDDRTTSANLAADGKAVASREHDVEHDEVILVHGRFNNGGFSIGHYVHRVRVLAKPLGEHRAEIRVILGQEESQGRLCLRS